MNLITVKEAQCEIKVHVVKTHYTVPEIWDLRKFGFKRNLKKKTEHNKNRTINLDISKLGSIWRCT